MRVSRAGHARVPLWAGASREFSLVNTTLISLRHRETIAGVASLQQRDFSDMMATVAAIDSFQQRKDENSSEYDIAIITKSNLHRA